MILLIEGAQKWEQIHHNTRHENKYTTTPNIWVKLWEFPGIHVQKIAFHMVFLIANKIESNRESANLSLRMRWDGCLNSQRRIVKFSKHYKWVDCYLKHCCLYREKIFQEHWKMKVIAYRGYIAKHNPVQSSW